MAGLLYLPRIFVYHSEATHDTQKGTFKIMERKLTTIFASDVVGFSKMMGIDEQKTLEIAKQLAEGPAVAFRYMKENLNRAVSGEVDDCLDLEVTHHVHCGQT